MTLAIALLMSAREYAIAANAELLARSEAEGFTVFFTMPEDEEYWAEQASEYGIVTGADVIRRDAIQCYSDTYKEVYGFRPRHVTFEGVPTDEIGVILTSLQREADAVAEYQSTLSLEDADEHPWEPSDEGDELQDILPDHLIREWDL